MKSCYDLVAEYVEGKNVLDVGSCANQGENIKTKTLFTLIKERASLVTGVDIESVGEDIVKGNAETIKLGRKFEVVVAGDIIEHLHNVGLFLDNMHEHLEDNGLLLIATPNAKSIGYLPFKGNDFHTSWYCKHTLKYIVEQHGFKVERVHIGFRKKKHPVKDFLRNYFANNLFFVCRKVNNESLQEENKESLPLKSDDLKNSL